MTRNRISDVSSDVNKPTNTSRPIICNQIVIIPNGGRPRPIMNAIANAGELENPPSKVRRTGSGKPSYLAQFYDPPANLAGQEYSEQCTRRSKRLLRALNSSDSEVSEATATLERITNSLDSNQSDDVSSSATDADTKCQEPEGTTQISFDNYNDVLNGNGSATSSSSTTATEAAVAAITSCQVKPGPRYRIVTSESPFAHHVKQQMIHMQQAMKPATKRKYFVTQGLDNTIEGFESGGELMYGNDCHLEEKMTRRANYSIQQQQEPKIPRPPNAFMIYANEYRRILASEYPKESNKEISVRLGTLWKHMTKDAKDKYFNLSRVVDAEHKKRYPNYVYNPKEARMRKAIRDQTREHNRMYNGKSPSPTKQRANNHIMHANEAPQGKPGVHQLRVLDTKRKLPMYHPQQQQWQDGATGGGNQYVGADAFLEMPFQSHDGTAYSGLVNQHNPWYPYMQQDGTAQYPHQVWSHHAPPAYVQQRVQYMAAQGHDAAAQGYINYEAAAAHNQQQQQQQQQQAAGPSRQANGIDTNEETPVATTSTPSTSFQEHHPSMTTAPSNNFPRQATTAVAKPTTATATKPPTNQAPVSPQMSPTKAYHKYLQGNELSPTTNWPSLYCMYSPQDEEGRITVANRSPSMSGEKPQFSYYNDNPPHQFTYYDYIMPGPEFMAHGGQDFGGALPAFAPQMFPPVSKAREYALGIREFSTPIIKKRTAVSGFPNDEDPLSICENAVLTSPTSNPSDEFTVVVNVVNGDTAKRSGARVIATYETQNNEKNKKTDKKNKALITRKSQSKNDILCDEPTMLDDDNDLANNSTFSFMQDPAYKNILTSIDGNDNSKIIQQNNNVCVMTNDAFDDQRNNFSCMSPPSHSQDSIN